MRDYRAVAQERPKSKQWAGPLVLEAFGSGDLVIVPGTHTRGHWWL